MCKGRGNELTLKSDCLKLVCGTKELAYAMMHERRKHRSRRGRGERRKTGFLRESDLDNPTNLIKRDWEGSTNGISFSPFLTSKLDGWGVRCLLGLCIVICCDLLVPLPSPHLPPPRPHVRFAQCVAPFAFGMLNECHAFCNCDVFLKLFGVVMVTYA